MNDLTNIAKQYQQAREKYKPINIKCVIIAEAPPDELTRFFYYPDVKKADFLFLGIINILYPELKNEYLQSRRKTSKKDNILKNFQNNGFYLIDLLEVPKTIYPNKDLSLAMPKLLTQINHLIDKNTPIIAIKANVFDIINQPLIEQGFNFIPKRIPFPSSGQQANFETKFRQALLYL